MQWNKGKNGTKGAVKRLLYMRERRVQKHQRLIQRLLCSRHHPFVTTVVVPCVMMPVKKQVDRH